MQNFDESDYEQEISQKAGQKLLRERLVSCFKFNSLNEFMKFFLTTTARRFSEIASMGFAHINVCQYIQSVY